MKSIKRNLLYNVLLNVSGVLFPLITAPYISRVLSPNDIGLYNFASTYSGYFALVAVLGIPTYGMRETARVRDDESKLQKLLCQLFSIEFFNTLLISILYIASIFLIGQLQDNYIIFLIVGIGLYLSPFGVDWFFCGQENFGYITFRSLVIKTLSVIGLFIFVRDKTDLINYILLGTFANIGNNIWNFILLYKKGYKIKITFHGLKQHLKPVLILFTSSIAVSIYTVMDTIMLGFMSNYTEVAYYNYASHISKTLVIAVASLSSVAVPRISYYLENEMFDDINVLITKSLSIVAFLSFPITMGLILIAPTFIPLFYGGNFYGVILPLQIMSFLLIAIGFNNITGLQCLIGLGKDNLFLYSMLSGTFFNLFLNIYLIPEFGAVGASFASIIAEFFILLVSGFLVYYKTPIKIHVTKEMLLSAIISITFIPLYYICKQFVCGWILVFCLIIICSVVYIGLQYIIKNPNIGILIEFINKKTRINATNKE